MNDELTAQDIQKMQAELDDRRLRLMPELIEEVKRTRAFGDLSENYEYKAAKQEQNRNKSRIRYLERMILGRKVGDTVTVRVSDTNSYHAEILSIEKQADDGSAPLRSF